MKFWVLGLAVLGMTGVAQAADVSAKRGEQLAITSGCHDCHTLNYGESGGKIDPAKALMGTNLGWQGPWGTTYPANLRLVAKDKGSEKAFLQYAKTFQARPPMPFYNVHAMSDNDIRSLYRYIVSLGDPGKPAPDFVPPGQTPKTPYIVIAPPIMPKE